MPPRAEPGDRERIWAELRAADRRVFVDLCELAGITPEKWPGVPALARVVRLLAVLRLADHFESAEGMSRDRAVTRACGKLCLNADSIKSLLVSMRDQGREPLPELKV